jgi:hypothetical protein
MIRRHTMRGTTLVGSFIAGVFLLLATPITVAAKSGEEPPTHGAASLQAPEQKNEQTPERTVEHRDGQTPEEAPAQSDGNAPEQSDGQTPQQKDGQTPEPNDGRTPDQKDEQTPRHKSQQKPEHEQGPSIAEPSTGIGPPASTPVTAPVAQGAPVVAPAPPGQPAREPVAAPVVVPVVAPVVQTVSVHHNAPARAVAPAPSAPQAQAQAPVVLIPSRPVLPGVGEIVRVPQSVIPAPADISFVGRGANVWEVVAAAEGIAILALVVVLGFRRRRRGDRYQV